MEPFQNKLKKLFNPKELSIKFPTMKVKSTLKKMALLLLILLFCLKNKNSRNIKKLYRSIESK